MQVNTIDIKLLLNQDVKIICFSMFVLWIEKGRHRKINLANRMCPLCRSEVEDEFHFSMICDKLKDIRDKFFQKLTDIVPLFSNFSDLDKFFFIFRSNDYDI